MRDENSGRSVLRERRYKSNDSSRRSRLKPASSGRAYSERKASQQEQNRVPTSAKTTNQEEVSSTKERDISKVVQKANYNESNLLNKLKNAKLPKVDLGNKVTWLKQKIKVFIPLKQLKMLYIASVGVIAILGGFIFINNRGGNDAEIQFEEQVQADTDQNPAALTAKDISFKVLEKPNTGNQDNGDTEYVVISPPEAPPVYAFIDQIDGVQIQVSQQELPEALANNREQALKDLAEGYSANEKITGVDFTAYLGKNTKDGPQSLILISEDLLILIKTRSFVSNDSWATYLNNLLGNN